MSEPLLILVYLAAVAGAGWPWAHLLGGVGGRLDRRAAAAAAFPLGAFLLAYTWFLLSLAGVRFDATVVTVTLAAWPLVGFGAVWLVRRRAAPREADASPAPGRWDRGARLLCAALLVFLAWQGVELVRHGYAGDGLAFWRTKAVYLRHEGTVYTDALTDPRALHANKHYPLLLPFLQAGLMTLDPALSQAAERVVFPAFLAALFLLAWAALRRRVGPFGSLLVLWLLALATFKQFAFGYCTVAMVVQVAALFVFLDRWREGGDRGALRLAAVFAAAMIFTKNEGPFYCGVLFALLLAEHRLGDRDRSRAAGGLGGLVKFLVAIAVLSLPWLLFKRGLAATWEIDLIAFLQPASLGPELREVPYLAAHLPLDLLAPGWGAFWLVGAWAVITGRGFRATRWFPPVVILAWAGLMIVLPFLEHLSLYTNYVDRFLQHLVGPVVVVIAAACGRARRDESDTP